MHGYGAQMSHIQHRITSMELQIWRSSVGLSFLRAHWQQFGPARSMPPQLAPVELPR